MQLQSWNLLFILVQLASQLQVDMSRFYPIYACQANRTFTVFMSFQISKKTFKQFWRVSPSSNWHLNHFSTLIRCWSRLSVCLYTVHSYLTCYWPSHPVWILMSPDGGRGGRWATYEFLPGKLVWPTKTIVFARDLPFLARAV